MNSPLREEGRINEDLDEEDGIKVILSVAYHQERLGVAYFIKSTGELGWGETQETVNFDSLEYIKFKIQPTLCLATSKSDFELYKNLTTKPIGNGNDGDDNENDESSEAMVDEDDPKKNQIPVKIMRFKDFSYDNGIKKLRELQSVLYTEKDQSNSPITSFKTEKMKDEGEEEEDEGESEKSSALPQSRTSAFQVNQQSSETFIFGIPITRLSENKQMVRAIGSLITFIQQNKLLFGGLNSRDCLQCIQTLSNITFEGFLQLDVSTIKALSIFKLEKHPCKVMKIGVPKEGMSLFGVLNQTKSKIGKELLRHWFLSPIMDLEELTRRSDAIEYFITSTSDDKISDIRENLKHIKDISKILHRFEMGKFSANDWLNLYKTLYCFKTIFEELIDNSQQQEQLHDENETRAPTAEKIFILKLIEETYNENVLQILTLLSDVFDFNSSKENKRMIILENVNSSLDNKKRIYSSLDTLLTLVAENEIQELPDDFPYQLSVAYFPQLGYLIVIEKDKTLTNPILTIDGYVYFFMSDDFVYYKNSAMREMDDEIGDIHEQIIDIESQIEYEVSKRVLEYKYDLCSVGKCSAILDCIVSLSVVAKEEKYVRPVMVNENCLVIVNGRNAIQEKCVSQFISNDTSVSDKSDRIQVITGPNMSGKSVYLKQIGLIVFMAHIGSFVPAESARIGLTDKILTRIHNENSVSVRHSTFAHDVLQIKNMIDTSTKNSLCLIDEFGKGTLALDGLALLGALLRRFIDSGENSPKVFVSTHYTELFQYNLIDLKSKFVKFMTMNIYLENNEDKEIDDAIVFLYKLTKGKVIPSYGIACAAMAKIPTPILARAKQISQCFRDGIPVTKMETLKSKQKKERFLYLIEDFKNLDLNNDDDIKVFLKKLKKN